MEFAINLFRTLFYSLDKVIYGLIDDVYGLLLQLSRTSIFDQAAIHQFSQRIYALVGIFMLFKVSVSLISYVLNPDEFSDKDKGFTSILKHVILSLVLIVLVPYIFSEAYDLQAIILEENTIMNVIFGSPSERDLPTVSYTETAGQKIQFTIMYAFAQPNYDDFSHDNQYDLIDCREAYDTYDSGSHAGEYKFRQTPKFGEEQPRDSYFIYELRPSCWGEYDAENDVYVTGSSEENGQLLVLFQTIDEESVYQDYAQGVAQQSFNLFFKKDAILAKEARDDGRYFINYRMGISTAVGVAVLYLLLMFCIDIAMRSVKLGFLQMIAPIPIISYCDPKSGKDGMFKKWTDMCVKTYLELFMRLASLFFGIYVISLIGTFRDVTTGEIVSGWMVSIFMILGILIFIKKLPEIMKEILNVKSDGKFTFNPLKKIEDEAIGGKRLTGLAAGAAIGTVGMATGAGLGRSLSGAFGGAVSGKGWGETLKNQRDKNAAMRTARLNGSTFSGRMGARFSNTLGSGGELARIAREKDAIETQQKRYDDQIKSIEDRIAPVKQQIADHKRFSDSVKALETRAKEEIQAGNGGTIGTEFLKRKAEFERLKSSGTASANDIANAEARMNEWLNKDGMRQYMTEASQHIGNFAGPNNDATFDNLRATAEQAGTTVGVTLSNDGATIHGQFGSEKGTVGALERSIYNDEQQIESIKVDKARLGDQMRQVQDRENIAKANQDAIK